MGSHPDCFSRTEILLGLEVDDGSLLLNLWLKGSSKGYGKRATKLENEIKSVILCRAESVGSAIIENVSRVADDECDRIAVPKVGREVIGKFISIRHGKIRR